MTEVNYAPLMAEVACRLLGEHNKDLSTKTDRRYGSHGSLSVDIENGRFKDHESGEKGGGVLDLIIRVRGGDRAGAFAWLVDEGLVDKPPNGAWADRITAVYQYTDAAGKLLYSVARFKEPKDFRQFRPLPGHPDERVWGLKGGEFVQHRDNTIDWVKASDKNKHWSKRVILQGDVKHTLYNLQQIANREEGAVIYLCEGEKDCITLAGAGLLATTNSGGAKYWAARHAELLRGADVVLILDNDPAGRERADKVVPTLMNVALRVQVLDVASVWPECPPKGDVTDWFEKGGGTAERLTEIVAGLLDYVPEEPPPPPPSGERWPDWDKKNDRPAATFTNACEALSRLDLNVYYDECRYRMMGLGKDLQDRGGNVSDAMSLRIRRLVRKRFGFDPGKDSTNDAIIDLAHDNKRHPFRDWLNSLTWDGTERLDKLFIDYFNVTDVPYHRAMSRIFLIAAVRRVRHPGTPFDLLPVLEGDQGWEKSNGIKALVGVEYHSDQSVWKVNTAKQQMELMEGVVIFETGELQGLSEARIDEIKTFASRTVDADRMSYDRFKDYRPRQCVFIGTTNKKRYLLDATGNRRFEPMKVNKPIDVALIKADRKQLWAEAAAREAKGESIGLPVELWEVAAQAQNARMTHDPWEDKLIEYLKKPHARIEFDKGHEIVSSTSLLSEALGLSVDRWEPKHTHRLGNIMRNLGWAGPNNLLFASGRAKGYRRTEKPEKTGQADLLDPTE